MYIPVNGDVYCTDGRCGRSTTVILNPLTDKVTHVVVAERGLLGIEHIVPLDQVVETTPASIHLRISAADLAKLDPFVEAHFIGVDEPYDDYESGTWVLWPYMVPEDGWLPMVAEEKIPPGELAIHRDAAVYATDGRIGCVDEFLVEPTTGYISHLVLREGHLWGQKDVTIPVAQIDKFDDDAVHLKLDKQHVAALPHIPVRRKAAP
ncbi:MAG TPA: PRC-barrel domain-containing protein [Caldilineaceae bacterium]|nr:PRC-barrel domain-containing protein [Caldilineaceae bacterium]